MAKKETVTVNIYPSTKEVEIKSSSVDEELILCILLDGIILHTETLAEDRGVDRDLALAASITALAEALEYQSQSGTSAKGYMDMAFNLMEKATEAITYEV